MPPRRVFSQSQAKDRVRAWRRLETNPSRWTPKRAADYEEFLTHDAKFWIGYRATDSDGHSPAHPPESFPRTGPYPPVFATQGARNVPAGDPYWEPRPDRPRIGDDKAINKIYENA